MCNNAHTDLLQDFTAVLFCFLGQFQTHLAAYANSVIQTFLISLYSESICLYHLITNQLQKSKHLSLMPKEIVAR